MAKDLVTIYGIHPVLEILKADIFRVQKIYTTEKLAKRYNEQFAQLGRKLQVLEPQDFKKKFSTELNHQYLIAEVQAKQFFTADDFIKRKQRAAKILILDQLTDVHNLGAIIRSAVAFNISDIFITAQNSLTDYGLLAKASAGLVEHCNLYLVKNLNSFLAQLKKQDYWCAGLAGEAKADISELKKFEKLALILGSEGQGIRNLVKENCDLLVRIEIDTKVESLNVSNAAAIALFTIG